MLYDIFSRCDTIIDKIIPSYFDQNHKNFQPSLLQRIYAELYTFRKRIPTNYNLKNPVVQRNTYLHHYESQN